MVVGKAGAVTAKLLSETVALLTVTAADPEFVAVMLSVLVVPATMLPKFRLVLARDKLPSACGWLLLGVLPALNPWQPAKKASPSRSINSWAILQELFGLPWAGWSRVGEFGVIWGHEPSPYSQH